MMAVSIRVLIGGMTNKTMTIRSLQRCQDAGTVGIYGVGLRAKPLKTQVI